MAWIKVPPEHHPLFREALPHDRRVQTQLMFGGVAAKVNGHIFAGLFGRSVMLGLSEADREEALALEGATIFDPMGEGKPRSNKVMLPEQMMDDAPELRTWIARAFEATAALPPKPAKAMKRAKTEAAKPAAQAAKPAPAKRPSARAAPAVKAPAKRPAKKK